MIGFLRFIMYFLSAASHPKYIYIEYLSARNFRDSIFSYLDISSDAARKGSFPGNIQEMIGIASRFSIYRETRRKHTLFDRSVRPHGSPAIYPIFYHRMSRPARAAQPLSRDASCARQYRLDVLSGP